jgi:hypothetical protein
VAVSVRAERVLAVTDVDLYADDLAQIRAASCGFSYTLEETDRRGAAYRPGARRGCSSRDPD